MKKLIAKIREILRNRRVRKLWTRIVSSIACLVVFVTTYALVLPAITMESQASCGIEAHQHDDSCYEERLTCNIPDSEGHTHTEDCYSTKQKLICDRSEHEHNSDCYDENGNLTCSLEEHQHGRECFEENRELVCGLEEAEGHHHDSSCYEKVLTCGKEAHTHSQACYREDAASAMATEGAAVASTTAASEGGNTAADANGADRSSDAFGTLDPAQTDSEGFVPASDELDLQQPLNSDATISNDSPAVDETRGSGNSDAGIISDDSSSAEENITEAVEETHPAVSFEDTLTVYTGSLGSDITGSLSSDMNAGNPGNDAAGNPDTDTAAGILPASSNLTVSVSAETGTFPAGTIMVLSAVTDMDAVAEAVEGTVDSKTRGFQAVDISFRDKDGNEIEPLKPISVTMRSDSIKAATEDSSMAPVVVHVEDRKKETAEAGDSPAATVIETLPDTAENTENSETPDVANSPDAISFEADAFSVYAIVYTVDFHYEVNGKEYDFSIPGGGFVSLEHLVEVLGITSSETDSKTENENVAESAESDDGEATVDAGAAQDTASSYDEAIKLNEVEVSEATKQFVENVESAEFSNPELVWVKKASEVTTVGGLKKANGLKAEYSGNLTKEQIAEIDAQTVEAGDWALISARPFTSEETLTVTMKNGEQFVVKVTDAQIVERYISDKGEMYEVTVTYGPDAQIPEGSRLKVTEFEEGSPEYISAAKAVLAAKKTKNDVAELESLGFAALDISILNPSGEEIEPAAPVHVDIQIKSLPGVENLQAVYESLEIQHHIETPDGVVVDTVVSGSTESAFDMQTNEMVVNDPESIAVDPATVSQKELKVLNKVIDDTAQESINTNLTDEEIGITGEFDTPLFSTFTITWGSGSSSSIQQRISSVTDGKYIIYAKDANDGNYYALVPGTELRSVPITIDDDKVVYNGDNLYWNINKNTSGGYTSYTFSFVENGTTYYLAEGPTGEKVTVSTSQVLYDDLGTTYWMDYGNCIHSGQDTFLQCYDGVFRTHIVDYDPRIHPGNDLIYFEKENANLGPHTTVHYGYMEGDTFVEFEDKPSPTDVSTDHHAYLIHDFPGYWYGGKTYYRINEAINGANMTSGATLIQPRLVWRRPPYQVTSRWQYYSNEWNDVAQNSHIYLVYDKKADTSQGGKPTIYESGDGNEPPVPNVLKSSKSNDDGTNTLSLSITGSTSTQQMEKFADVVILLDVSGSMNENMAGEMSMEWQQSGFSGRWVEVPWHIESERRLSYAKQAVNNLADNLLARVNQDGEKLIKMGLVTFSTSAETVINLTDDLEGFKSQVNGLSAGGGTNWEKALNLANQMAVDPDRATFVIFVTDGDPTFRMRRMGATDAELYQDIFSYDVNDNYYLSDYVFGKGDTDIYGRNYDGAVDEAKTIVSNNKILYTVGIAKDSTNLANFSNDVGAAHYFTSEEGQDILDAFDDIGRYINAISGQADVKMFDGITDLTQTISKVNQTEENRLLGVDGDFTYWKSSTPTGWHNWTDEQKEAYTQGMDYKDSTKTPEDYASWSDERKAAFQIGKNVTFTEWTTREKDGCAEAVYNTETGAVEWNMGKNFMLEDGVTYRVSFTCWPSQKAYDIIAKLNNGTITFGDTTLYSKEVWDQFEGDVISGYTLKTNAEGANTKYSAATNVDGLISVGDEQEPLPFQHVPPMPLDRDKLNVAKTWQASKIDTQTPESVILQVVGDNELYKQFEIEPTETANGSATPNKGKSDDIYISCGHLKVNKDTGEVVVYESGHDFTLREVEENSRHWDLDASICRPMKINTHETMLIRVEGDKVPAGMADSVNYYASGNDEYYRIDGKVYKDTKAWADITGANTRRSFLDLAKEVLVDNKDWTEPVDTKFTYKIKINIDPTTLSWDPDLEKYIIISVRGDGYSPAAAIADTTYLTTAKLPSQSGMPSTLIHEGDDNLYLVAESGVEFYLSIKSGWSVRFLNLPSGTTYSIEEVLPEDSDYDFNNARLEIRKDSSSVAPLSKKEYSTVKVEEGITETSTLYKVVYQNDAKGKEVQIMKTEQDASTPLGDAKFDLYTESAYISDPQGAPFKPDLVSSNQTDKKGQIDLGKLPVGKYYLVETKAPDGYTMRTDPVVITVSKSSVTYSDGTNLSMSGSGISQIGDVFQLKVTNDAGVELPSTGGPGTRFFTILGSILILGAGALLWRRRRFI